MRKVCFSPCYEQLGTHSTLGAQPFSGAGPSSEESRTWAAVRSGSAAPRPSAFCPEACSPPRGAPAVSPRGLDEKNSVKKLWFGESQV